MAIAFMGIIIKEVMDESGAEYEISSGIEGEHQRGSLHFIGHAVDVSIRNRLDRPVLEDIFLKLDDRLGDDFDVVPDYSHPKFHIEYQPKTSFGRLGEP